MRRQLPPSHLKVPPGPQAFPQRHFLDESAVIGTPYLGIERAIPSLPGFRTSAGMFMHLSLSSYSFGVLLVDCTSSLALREQQTQKHSLRHVRANTS